MIDRIDPNKLIHRRLYRQHGLSLGPIFVKDAQIIWSEPLPPVQSCTGLWQTELLGFVKAIVAWGHNACATRQNGIVPLLHYELDLHA